MPVLKYENNNYFNTNDTDAKSLNLQQITLTSGNNKYTN